MVVIACLITAIPGVASLRNLPVRQRVLLRRLEGLSGPYVGSEEVAWAGCGTGFKPRRHVPINDEGGTIALKGSMLGSEAGPSAWGRINVINCQDTAIVLEEAGQLLQPCFEPR